MTSTHPLVLPSQGTLARFLFPPVIRGGEARVLSDPANEGFTLAPSLDKTREFPNVDTLRSIVDLNRAQLIYNEFSAGHRDALGRNLNNLAAQFILDARALDALKGLVEAEEQFIAIVKMFPSPVPRALIGLATVRYNIGVLHHLYGSPQNAAEMVENARNTILSIPADERDFGYGFFAEALNELEARI